MRIALAGAVFLGLAYLLLARQSALWQFYLLYCLMGGLGTAAFMAPLLANVGKWFERNRGMAIGFATAVATAVVLAELSGSPWKRRMLAIFCVFLIPVIFPLVSGKALPRTKAASMAGYITDFDSLDARFPERRTAVADPTTSYLLPALTSFKVMCTFDQHGTPNDARALERIGIAREILSPTLPDSAAWRMAREEKADYVLFWKHATPVLSLYWQADREATEARINQFLDSPYFRSVPSPDAFAVFAVVDTPNVAEEVKPIAFPLDSVPAERPLVEAFGLRGWSGGIHEEHIAPGDTPVLEHTANSILLVTVGDNCAYGKLVSAIVPTV